jgi:hypothetical protein
MAMAVQLIRDGINFKQYRVTATDDLDHVVNIDHDMALPPIVILMPRNADVCKISAWACYSPGLDQVALEKTMDAGSGNADPQLEVFLLTPGARVLG